MKPKSAKAKGRKLQNWVAEKLAELTGFKWGQDEVIAPREMGQGGTDIRLVGDAAEALPWSIECKNAERWNLSQWISQAQQNSALNRPYLLFCKRNRQQPVVVLDAEVFFQLLAEIDGPTKGLKKKTWV